MQHPELTHASQGHLYEWAGKKVIALNNGPAPTVAPIDQTIGWLQSHRFTVEASQLTPLPMAYFHGQVPHATR